MYNAVGIDASKLKSTITIIQPAGVVIRKPFDVLHTSDELNTLRKTLFQVMSTYLQNKPVNEPVYQFLDRKRAEGKPYLVYMTAGANKFLRIYYGKVKECLRNLEQSQIEES